ncbi:hypothetical protein H4R35_002127 [Dimargaris xerosporica]|nr:hypothetical protein H4R35_002127 [Dimargaris xerosporica]
MAADNSRNSLATVAYSIPGSDYCAVAVSDPTPTASVSHPLTKPSRGLEWTELTYRVATKHEGLCRRATGFKTILHGISGRVMPGELVAIMGSSGAGKSTLLNALAGRLTMGQLSGQVLFSGKKRIPSKFKKQVAYVEQDDLMYSQLSVRETIQYAATLRLSSKEYDARAKAVKVDGTLDSLRLAGVADTFIGDALVRGVSGGERKRTAIGVELVTDPEFMFLDEATSGLDSNSAYHVCELVKDVVEQRNMGALMTIHQPNAQTFRLFDKVILLSRGHVVYFGPVDTALEYFAALGYRCGQYDNPADFYLDLMTIDNSTDEKSVETNARVEHLVVSYQQYANSQSDKHNHRDTAKPITPDTGQNIHGYPESAALAQSDPGTIGQSQISLPVVVDHPSSGWALPWVFEFLTLLERCWKAQLRNKFFIMANIIQYILLFLLLGFTFFQIDTTQSSIQNRIGLLLFLPVGYAFGVIAQLLGVFSKERGIMLRERSVGSYRITSFYLAKFITELPFTLGIICTYLTGVYFLAHLQYEADKYFIYLGINALNIVTSISIGMAIGAACETLQVAEIVSPLVQTVFMIYAGNFVNTDDITPVLSWIRFLSNTKYAYQALTINEFTGVTFECSDVQDAGCFKTGEAVLANYSLDSLSISTCLGLMVAVSAFFHAIGYASLRWKSKPHYIWL